MPPRYGLMGIGGSIVAIEPMKCIIIRTIHIQVVRNHNGLGVVPHSISAAMNGEELDTGPGTLAVQAVET